MSLNDSQLVSTLTSTVGDTNVTSNLTGYVDEIELTSSVSCVIDSTSGVVVGTVGTPIPEEFKNHIKDYNNPHRTTAKQVGAVPIDISTLPELDLTVPGVRNIALMYAYKNTYGFKVTLEQVKSLNTKIIFADNIESIDTSKISLGDFVYLKN